jgi:hypothetical protein
MPSDAFTHFVFVDFENVPDVDLAPLNGHRVVVTLFLGKKSKLKTGLVEQITRLPFEVRLIKIGKPVENGLDFVLAFHLGRTAGRYPGARFSIVTKDKKDFDPLVTQLHTDHVRVERVESIAALPFLRPANPAAPVKAPAPDKSDSSIKKSAEDKTTQVIARLMNPITGNRPTTRVRLIKRLKNDIGKNTSDSDATDAVGRMEKLGLRIEPTGKLIYPPAAKAGISAS